LFNGELAEFADVRAGPASDGVGIDFGVAVVSPVAEIPFATDV
jgi:hypothetical protein